MKKLILFVLLSTQVFAAPPTRLRDTVIRGSLAVGSTAVANSKSVLDVVSTTKGALLPRMTEAQRDAISAPPTGLIVYNTDTSQLNQYNGSVWKSVSEAMIPDQSYEISNLALTPSMSGNALTIAVKSKAGTDPTASDAVKIGFRSATAGSGVYVQRTVTSALSVVISSGSTLGHRNAIAQYIYVYAIDNAGTVELAVSTTPSWSEGSVQSTTAEGGAGAADSATALYSAIARTGVAIRLIGRLKSTQATAGTWVTAISETSLTPFGAFALRQSVHCYTGNGLGGSSSGETFIRNFTNCSANVAAITRTARTTTTADYFTVNEDGIYNISYSDIASGTASYFGMSRNSSQLSTAIDGITATDILKIGGVCCRNLRKCRCRSSSFSGGCHQGSHWDRDFDSGRAIFYDHKGRELNRSFYGERHFRQCFVHGAALNLRLPQTEPKAFLKSFHSVCEPLRNGGAT